MKYGIQESQKTIKCANCGHIISRDGKYDDNYCYHCGNPLKMESIDEHEKRLENAQNDSLEKIKNYLVKNEILTKEQVDQLMDELF